MQKVVGAAIPDSRTHRIDVQSAGQRSDRAETITACEVRPQDVDSKLGVATNLVVLLQQKRLDQQRRGRVAPCVEYQGRTSTSVLYPRAPSAQGGNGRRLPSASCRRTQASALPAQASVIMQGKVFALWAKYDNRNISTSQLLRACSYLYAPNADHKR